MAFATLLTPAAFEDALSAHDYSWQGFNILLPEVFTYLIQVIDTADTKMLIPSHVLKYMDCFTTWTTRRAVQLTETYESDDFPLSDITLTDVALNAA
jgi:hypothetical protein